MREIQASRNTLKWQAKDWGKCWKWFFWKDYVFKKMCFFEPWNILIYDLGYLFIGNPKLDCIWYLSMKYKIQGFFFFFCLFLVCSYWKMLWKLWIGLGGASCTDHVLDVSLKSSQWNEQMGGSIMGFNLQKLNRHSSYFCVFPPIIFTYITWLHLDFLFKY